MKLSVPNRLKGKKLYKEVWKPVVLLDSGESYEGLYEVSNMGRVRNSRTGRMLKIRKDNKKGYGYLQVDLYKDGKCKTFKVHRLVAFAFIPNPNNLPIVNHKDEDKSNNCEDNLEWCTIAYNNSYGTRLQRVCESLKGKSLSEEHKKKLSEANKKKVYCVETNKTYPSIKECAEELGLFDTSISAVCKGKQKHHKGFHFYYEEDILYKS